GRRNEPFYERLQRRPNERHGQFAGVYPEDGVGLLNAGGKDPARAVVLETSADDPHAVGDECGGEGVAGTADERFAVADEPHGLVPVYASAACEPEGLAGGHSAVSRSSGFGSPMR